MSRTPPPLNGLRAFEAAARHLSFTRAADELNVTPAAVGQQVRNLEDILGVPLFRRLTRALMLTEEGQLLLPHLIDGFDKIEAGVKRLKAESGSGELTVSAAPSFAAKWLVRRLPRFQARHPDIRIRIDPTLNIVDFARENVDIAIRFGLGDYPGMRVDRLMTEHISPVCSPKLLEGDTPIKTPHDLADHRLIHVDWGLTDMSQPDWAMWLMTAGAPEVDAGRGPVFTTEVLAIEAAIESHGVALINRAIVLEDVAAGRLVWPFELTLSTDFGFFVVCPEQTAEMRKNAVFRDWLLEESRTDALPEP